ncbi:MAG TPA: ATP-binding cassette domain-containing protein, partial [Syntrophales bacterium]|nr:ATP-binding cassette domain-containing protein [Syntrophales bacterium]
MADRLLELESVSCGYRGGEAVLRDVSFALREKRRVAVIGPNGSGKTTLFHVIMGLIKPHAGRLQVFGRPIEGEKDFFFVRRQVGYLFQ